MTCDNLFSKIDSLEEQYIELWKEICEIESPTSYKRGLDLVGECLCRHAEDSSLEYEIIPQEAAGNLVKITLNNASDKKPIILSAHIDTVHPVGSFGYPSVRIQDGIIYGPGVVDDKGGAAAALYAMDALKKIGYTERNVVFIAQTDEEDGSTTSHGATIDYICNQARECEAFINLERFHTGTAVIIRKGISIYKLIIKGMAAHSAVCCRGANAVLEASHKIIDIERYSDPDTVTCNCSMISGGIVSNSVPDRCEFTVDVRYFTSEQAELIERELRAIADKSYIGNTTCEMVLVSHRPAMEPTDKNVGLLSRMNRIYELNDMEQLKAGTSLGGSDAANVSSCGVAAVDSIACEGGKLHTTEEFAYISSLKEAAKRIASVIYCYDTID